MSRWCEREPEWHEAADRAQRIVADRRELAEVIARVQDQDTVSRRWAEFTAELLRDLEREIGGES